MPGEVLDRLQARVEELIGRLRALRDERDALAERAGRLASELAARAAELAERTEELARARHELTTAASAGGELEALRRERRELAGRVDLVLRRIEESGLLADQPGDPGGSP